MPNTSTYVMCLCELEEGNVQTLAELLLEGKECLRKGTFANECKMGNPDSFRGLGTLWANL